MTAIGSLVLVLVAVWFAMPEPDQDRPESGGPKALVDAPQADVLIDDRLPTLAADAGEPIDVSKTSGAVVPSGAPGTL